uniref:Large ribosomal subunit protein bL28c n=1 Tax=Pyropia haitanensis TaxID=1262161 RepID=M9PRQ5_PYRHA|nr:ribosomal protein L28 [Neoporphyra haitanensis]AGG37002.1 ribosomal protein L28 [Neoporphyra haitanensis]
MSKKCQLTGKVANNGYAVSHSHKRTKKLQKVNLQQKKVWSREKNKWIKMLVSAKAIKTLTKNL